MNYSWMKKEDRVKHLAATRANRFNFNVRSHYTHTEWYHLSHTVKEIIEDEYDVTYNTSQGYFLKPK